MTSETSSELQEILRRLADRSRLRSEATLQADVRQLLLTGGLNLADHDLTVELETQVGDRRRIDIEVGYTVIEIKKDLRSAAVLRDAIQQLAGYVKARTQQTEQRYVGVLTDGVDWRAFSLQGDDLIQASQFTLLKRTDGTDVLLWLEGVLATREEIIPTPEEIKRQLGAESVSYDLDYLTLASLYEQNKELPTVRLKRNLWSQLLRSALGAQFKDDDELFIEHTLLVNTAEIIAHLVLGIQVTDLSPATILRGETFNQARIYGVVDSDFFDWVVEVPGGESFIRTMARRLSRFAWANVEHDVLKVLYESVISTETRKAQGEYYTPDWLAEHMVNEVIEDPLNQRVLDPACGSGTFLFHSVRRYLRAAEDAGKPLGESLDGLTEHVAGIDLHPVAVTLARVTYLLAIGRERLLSNERKLIRVPVYLGDSVQWEQRLDLIDHGHLVIRTGTGDQLFENELRFPEHLLQNSVQFDQLVSDLAERAADSRRIRGRVPSLAEVFRRHAVTPEDQSGVTANFELLCRLVDEGRNHIWSYYVRNLARPMWLTREENRVDILIGNPPWLSFRHMPEEMQRVFKAMSQERGLWRGDQVANLQDLSGLFIARTAQQYLRTGGRFAFVVPNPVLDRPYWTGFRAGRFRDPSDPIDVSFTGSWDLRRLRPHFFPRGSAVVFGNRVAPGGAQQLPIETMRWEGRIPKGANTWGTAHGNLTRSAANLSVANEGLVESPYRTRFTQGAAITPRVLFFVEQQQSGPLGLGGGRVRVRSSRSSNEKKPWKELPSLEGIVEAEFVRPILLGESTLPYRVLQPQRAVLPLEGNIILDGEHPHLDRYPDLAQWWREAEAVWESNRRSDRLTLNQQLDFRRKLSVQLPIPPLRFVYAKSGMHACAAIVEEPNAIIDQALYWSALTSRQEGNYLCAIINTPALTELLRPLMSYGKDERHIDTAIWQLPIPLFDATNSKHVRLAELGVLEADYVSRLPLDETKNFVTLRRQIRASLLVSPNAEELDELVRELLD
ncbi:N-6 DNA methylase [[Kitasatospora] papulosa]|uniref:N-6 DNA methylase n=1 Tax=[Kitasatospora] papulosa TaxID=1464011 RepID=UPI0036B28643